MREPKGIIGRLFFGHYLNIENSKTIKFTIDTIKIQTGDHILDVGFGGGLSIQLLVPLVCNGLVAGIDISEPMIKNEKKKFAAEIAKGIVLIEVASISGLPFKEFGIMSFFTS